MSNKLFFALLLFFFIAWVSIAFISNNTFGFAGNDYEEHYTMALNKDYSVSYAPLFRGFSQFFVYTENNFQFFCFVVLIIIPCVLLFKITGEPLVPIFFFACSNLFYFFMAAIFGQLLVFIFILALILAKNNYVRLGLVVIGSLSNTIAFVFLPVVFLLILLNEMFGCVLKKRIDFFLKKFWKMFVLGVAGCSPFWQNKMPAVLNEGIGGTSYYFGQITLNKLLSFFIKVSPLPFVYVAFREFYARARFDLLLIWFGGFFGAWIFGDRTFYLCGLMVLIGFCWAWKGLEHKKFWAVLVLFYLVFLAQQFVWVRWFC